MILDKLDTTQEMIQDFNQVQNMDRLINRLENGEDNMDAETGELLVTKMANGLALLINKMENKTPGSAEKMDKVTKMNNLAREIVGKDILSPNPSSNKGLANLSNILDGIKEEQDGNDSFSSSDHEDEPTGPASKKYSGQDLNSAFIETSDCTVNYS